MEGRAMTPSASFEGVKDLDTLYTLLEPLSIGAGWAKPTPSLWPSPKTDFRPAHWSYQQGKAALDAAGRLIDTELAERRNLILANPFPGNTYATARTLIAAYQMMLPGERARSHRHTPNALRLIVDCVPGAYTVVDGVKLPMLPGDVLLTPNWRWHGHGNTGDQPAYWIDVLDAPLIHLLEPMFLEAHPENYEAIESEAQTSPMWFPWAETKQKLAQLERTPTARYATSLPLGNPAMETIGLSVMDLTAGVATQTHRTTVSNIYAVINGEGTSDIGGTIIRWRRGDVFVAPSWFSQSHRSEAGAVLLRVSDEPMLEKLKLVRTDADIGAASKPVQG